MIIIERDRIERAVRQIDLISVIEEGFVAYSQGKVMRPSRFFPHF